MLALPSRNKALVLVKKNYTKLEISNISDMFIFLDIALNFVRDCRYQIQGNRQKNLEYMKL